MSAAAGWAEGLAPLIQNLSNVYGSGAQSQQATLDRQYESDLEHARHIPRTEIMSRVEGAKAAGLHPLAALGVNVGNYSSTVGNSGTQDMTYAMGSYGRNQNSDLSRRLLAAQVKEAEANADIATTQAKRSKASLAGQPGNPPLVDLNPNQVIRTAKGRPMQAQGINPSQETYSVPDYWTGEPVNVDMPSEKFGQVMENSGEVAAAIMAAPYVAKSLFAQYLQSPLNAVKRNSELYRFWVNPRSLLAPKLYYKERR